MAVKFALAVIIIISVVTFLNYERRDPEEDLKLIESGDLVMCTAEKLPINVPEKGMLVHIVAAISIRENSVEDRELRGWILNNDAVVRGIARYEELNKNCEGEVIFVEAESEKAKDLTNSITTKGLPLEMVYTPPLPTQFF